MSSQQTDSYYSARAVAARDMARRAKDRTVASIHAEMAAKYEELARSAPARQEVELSLVAS